MNVYDFDGTIFFPDCVVSFALWCGKKYPKLWFTYAPKAFWNMVLYNIGIIPRHKAERRIFSIFGMIDDVETEIERYWDTHDQNISAWYLAQKKPDDLIISASPDCIIAPIAKRLGVNHIATDYDIEYGVFLNNFMFAKEKARYIFDHGFPVIDNFYSDSLVDTPIALCAEKAHFITNRAQKVNDWPELDEITLKKVHRKIDTATFGHIKK